MDKKEQILQLKFEDALQRLEKIVGVLEQGNIPLDEALKCYEEGIALTRYLASKIQTAEKKVEELIKDEQGNLILKPLETDLPRKTKNIGKTV